MVFTGMIIYVHYHLKEGRMQRQVKEVGDNKPLLLIIHQLRLSACFLCHISVTQRFWTL